jgi:hypothetical protein
MRDKEKNEKERKRQAKINVAKEERKVKKT